MSDVRHDDACEENDDFKRRHAPELIHGIWWSDQVSDSMNDNSGQRRVWNVEKDCRKGIYCKEDNDSGDHTSKRRSDTSFGFDG